MVNPNRQVPKPGAGWHGDPERHSRVGKLGGAALWRKIKDGTVKWRKPFNVKGEEVKGEEGQSDTASPTYPVGPYRRRRRLLEFASVLKEEE